MLRRGSGPPPVGSGAGSRRPFADRGGEAQRHGSSDPARLGASLQRRGRGGPEVALEPGSDRKRVVWGKSVSVRVDLGGRRIITKKKYNTNHVRDIIQELSPHDVSDHPHEFYHFQPT